MSRLEWLQMKRTCASYGPPLTPDEQIELFRLEAKHRGGRGRPIGGAEELTDHSAFAASTPVPAH